MEYVLISFYIFLSIPAIMISPQTLILFQLIVKIFIKYLWEHYSWSLNCIHREVKTEKKN
jgi:hypothetical protein